MRIYQIDSFTDRLFSGNPAGVCLLEENWLPDELMQNIAAENNLSETAFVRRGETWEIRWFTPSVEVGLCGHATLAAAHALFFHENVRDDVLVFKSKRGIIKVERDDEMLVLDFPQDNINRIDLCKYSDVFQTRPKEFWRGTEEYIFVYENESDIENAVCDLQKAAETDLSGFIITAASNRAGIDFVSRYFAPKIGIDEDPVTGSAHTLLAPYWQGVTGKNEFIALQISKRGGRLHLNIEGDRVKIGGKAVTFFAGEAFI